MARGRARAAAPRARARAGDLASADERLQAIDAPARRTRRPRRPTWPSSSRAVGRAPSRTGPARRGSAVAAADEAERGLRDAEDALRRRRASASPARGARRGAGPPGRRRERRARRRRPRPASPASLGVLMDLVDVDDGWAAAFEAAVGAALGAVVVDGSDRRAPRSPCSTSSDVVGHRPRRHRRAPTALGRLAGRSTTPAPPTVPSPCARHVRPRVPAVAGVLDRLLAGVVAVRGGWARAVEVPSSGPTSSVVSTDGRPLLLAGWVVRAGAHALATAGHARRAVEAEMAAEAAERASSFARPRPAQRADGRGGRGRRRRPPGRAGRRPAPGARDDAGARVESELELVGQERAEADRHRAALAERLERDGAQLDALERAPARARSRRPPRPRAGWPPPTRPAGASRSAGRRWRCCAGTSRSRWPGLAERRAVLERPARGHRAPAGRPRRAEREQAGERRRRLRRARSPPTAWARWSSVTPRAWAELLERLRARRSRQLDDVRAGGARLEIAAQAAGRGRRPRWPRPAQRSQRLELELAESRVRQRTAVEALRRELGCEPEEAMGAPCPELPEGDDPARRADGRRARAGLARPGQPPGPGGARRARGAAPVPRGAGRGRPPGPARAAPGDPGRRRRDHAGVRRRPSPM